MLSGEATNTKSIVFGLTRQSTVCYSLHHPCGLNDQDIKKTSIQTQILESALDCPVYEPSGKKKNNSVKKRSTYHRIYNNSNPTSATSWAGTPDLSEAPELTPVLMRFMLLNPFNRWQMSFLLWENLKEQICFSFFFWYYIYIDGKKSKRLHISQLFFW